jgi:outer membrane lipoprotein-sorting protein
MILISTTTISSLSKIIKSASVSTALVVLFLTVAISAPVSGSSGEDRVVSAAQRMESEYKSVVDYSCEVEQIFYRDGMEDQRFRFKFYFKRKKRIRVDFSQPYAGLSIFYTEGDKEATVVPFHFLPGMKFKFSIDSPFIKTLAGQRINQTDMGYFIEFVIKNLRGVTQEENEYQEDGKRITFLLWATDYIEEKKPEKYRISISKQNWLPVRIERYDLENRFIEVTDIKNYTINSYLEEKIFVP